MNKLTAILMSASALTLFTVAALAATAHGDKETKEDVCNKELQAACKGLAIGKYCGMKHEH